MKSDHFYHKCVYTIRKREHLDAACTLGVEFVISTKQNWKSAIIDFQQALAEGKEYIAIISDAANTQQINHIGLIKEISYENDAGETRVIFSKVLAVEEVIFKTDIRLSSGKNIDPGFIRPYAICETPDFNVNHSSETVASEMTNDEFSQLEGWLSWENRQIRNRNRFIVDEKRNHHLRTHGNLRCEVCDFSFIDKYGFVKEFMDVHHKTLISNSDGEIETRLSDLAIVCPNCHRSLHTKKPPFSIDELKSILLHK